MTAKARKAINNKIHALTTNTYHAGIPLGHIDDFMRGEGFFIAQEDGAPWEGFLTGAEGRASFDIGILDHTTARTGMCEIDEKVSLTLTWYKMVSGRYEIVAYVF